MNDPLSSTARPCSRSRATAILGLVALALLQISLAAHQFEHSADHGFNICDACTAYSQLEDTPFAGAAHPELPIARKASIDAIFASPATTLFVATYRSRAPPLS